MLNSKNPYKSNNKNYTPEVNPIECSLILNKELIYRTKAEMQILINFMSSIDFFKLAQLPNNTFNDYIIQICMHMKLNKYNKGQSVYDFGDSDSNFYLILKGHFVVFIPVNQEEQIQNEFIELLKINKQKKEIYFNSEGGVKFSPLSVHSEQEIFGESMINNMHLNRTEMVLSCQDGLLGVLSLKKYIEIIQNCWLGIKFDVDTIESYLEQKLDSDSLLKMFKLQIETKYQAGQCIYKEGDSPYYIYLIKSGEIHLCRKSENNQLNAEKQNYITTLYQGMLFGDKEITDDRCRDYTAIAANDCVIYLIIAESFKQLSQQQKKYDLNAQINLINNKPYAYIMGDKKLKLRSLKNDQKLQDIKTYKHQTHYTQTSDKPRITMIPTLNRMTFVPYNKNQDYSKEIDKSFLSIDYQNENQKNISNEITEISEQYKSIHNKTQFKISQKFSMQYKPIRSQSQIQTTNNKPVIKLEAQVESHKLFPKLHIININQEKQCIIQNNNLMTRPLIQTNFIRQGRKAVKVKLQKQYNINELLKIQEQNCTIINELIKIQEQNTHSDEIQKIETQRTKLKNSQSMYKKIFDKNKLNNTDMNVISIHTMKNKK